MRATNQPLPAKAAGELLKKAPEVMQLFATQANVLGVGMGLLQGGKPVAEEFRKIYFHRFCDTVRSSRKGRRACYMCDRRACMASGKIPCRRTPAEIRRFQCHMKLVDLPVPLHLRGRYFGHLFMGQLRVNELTDRHKAFLTKRFHDLELVSEGVTLAQFLSSFEDIPLKTLKTVAQIDCALHELANSTSHMLEATHAMHELDEISRQLLSINDLEVGLSIALRETGRVLNADSGSIWLAHRANSLNYGVGYGSHARPIVLQWFGAEEDEHLRRTLRVPISGKGRSGLAGWVVAKGSKPLILNSVNGIENVPAVYKHLRMRRRLASFVGAPIVSEGALIGFIELGSRRAEHFRVGDGDLLTVLARFVANYIRRTKERDIVIDIHRSTSRESMLEHLETELPLLFGSSSAVFLVPAMIHGRAVVTPFNPMNVVAGLGPSGRRRNWSPSYDVEKAVGLTGYAAKYRVCVRVSRCGDRREIRRLHAQGTFRSPNGSVPPKPPRWSGNIRTPNEARRRRASYPVLICPCLSKTGELMAVLQLSDRDAGRFRLSDQAYAESLCREVAARLEGFRDEATHVAIAAQRRVARLGSWCVHDFHRGLMRARAYIGQLGHAAERKGLGTLDCDHAVEQLMDLSGQVKEIQRLAEGGVQGDDLSYHEFNCCQLVEEIVARHKKHAAKTGRVVTFKLDLEPGGIVIVADRAEMRACLDAILDNALVSLEEKEGDRHIVRMECIRKGMGSEVVIRCSDSGDGFPPEVLSEVRAGRPAPPDMRRGMGRGLQGCKLFVENVLHGSFVLENDANGGAVVEWRFRPISGVQQ